MAYIVGLLFLAITYKMRAVDEFDKIELVRGRYKPVNPVRIGSVSHNDQDLLSIQVKGIKHRNGSRMIGPGMTHQIIQTQSVVVADSPVRVIVKEKANPVCNDPFRSERFPGSGMNLEGYQNTQNEQVPSHKMLY